ncbi:hypothetical protein ACFL1X_03840 [Candidatus Hydrogenedentota bacterium]
MKDFQRAGYWIRFCIGAVGGAFVGLYIWVLTGRSILEGIFSASWGMLFFWMALVAILCGYAAAKWGWGEPK